MISDYIIIVGCRNFGSHLANMLSEQGHSVVVIDQSRASFDQLSVNFSGFKLEGNPAEMDVLRQAKMAQARMVITATRSDNLNLFVAQIAKQLFRVPEVIARIVEPQREEIFRKFGIITICPTSLAIDAFLHTTDIEAGGAK